MSEPVLVVEGLDAYYESAHVLQGVNFEMGEETVAVVGRNGMGKTTLCTAIMGLMPSMRGSVRGSIRFLGKEIVGALAGGDRRQRESATSPRAGGSSPRSPSTSTCA